MRSIYRSFAKTQKTKRTQLQTLTLIDNIWKCIFIYGMYFPPPRWSPTSIFLHFFAVRQKDDYIKQAEKNLLSVYFKLNRLEVVPESATCILHMNLCKIWRNCFELLRFCEIGKVFSSLPNHTTHIRKHIISAVGVSWASRSGRSSQTESQKTHQNIIRFYVVFFS